VHKDDDDVIEWAIYASHRERKRIRRNQIENITQRSDNNERIFVHKDDDDVIEWAIYASHRETKRIRRNQIKNITQKSEKKCSRID
jgi:hypothetical protein